MMMRVSTRLYEMMIYLD